MLGWFYYFIYLLMIISVARMNSWCSPYNLCKKYYQIKSPFWARILISRHEGRAEDQNKLSLIALIQYIILIPVLLATALVFPIGAALKILMFLMPLAAAFAGIKWIDVSPAVREYKRQRIEKTEKEKIRKSLGMDKGRNS